MLVGYARVSTAEQDAGLEAQIRDLNAFRLKLPDGTEAAVEKIFDERASAAKYNDNPKRNNQNPAPPMKNVRPQLVACLDFMRKGDTLVVTKPDRLARNTQKMLEIEERLTKGGMFLIVLSMGGLQLDTRNPTSKLLLTMMAAIATWERDIMIERQKEGIRKAVAEGRVKGKQRDPKRLAAVQQALARGATVGQIAKAVGCNLTTIQRIRWGGEKATDPSKRPPLPPITASWLTKQVKKNPAMLGKPLDMDALYGPWKEWSVDVTDPGALGQALVHEELPDL